MALGCLLILSTLPAFGQGFDPIAFWDTPQHGANSFNVAPPDGGYFKTLRATGATWVRLAFSKWKGKDRDFLMKNADHYSGLSKPDLAILVQVLNAAREAGIKVVIVPLSLPGDRWNQQNGGKDDDRLWSDKAYWKQAADFWRDLTAALKGNPAVVGYNILNEPSVEKKLGLDALADAKTLSAWYHKYQDTAHDLPGFYNYVTAAIREVDSNVPILVDSGWYADPQGFSYWPSKLADGKTLYSFHMYHPYEATGVPNLKRNPPYRYPGVRTWYGPREVVWNKAMVDTDMSGAFQWAAAHGVPANRVVAGELGCMRQWIDCGAYLTDVLDLLDARNSHWAFYSFREDAWEGMDYELSPEIEAGGVL